MNRIFCLLFALTVATPALIGGEGWLTDLKSAQEMAKSEHKPLLMDFTGSDWCGWCIKLKAEVFSTK